MHTPTNTSQRYTKRHAAFKQLLPHSYDQAVPSYEASAPVNIALIKYWGKRDIELNLPITDSFSVALQTFSTTHIERAPQNSKEDRIFLNGKRVLPSTPFAQKLTEYLSHIRPYSDFYFAIQTQNDVPTGAGLASSASGFAACVKALDGFFGWNLPKEKLSCLARLGSGSASRSLFSGFCHWKKGETTTGEDSYGIPLAYRMPELRLGILLVSSEEKPISSREAMMKTVDTSPLYDVWPKTVKGHLNELFQLLSQSQIDFHRFGQIVEHNAMAMHATMIASRPSVVYWTPKSVEVMHRVRAFRENHAECPLYMTMDAGPNVKILFRDKDLSLIAPFFPELQVVPPLW